jgi:hypothetical protein
MKVSWIVLLALLGSALVGCSTGEVDSADVEDWKNQGLSKEEQESMPDPNADR